MGGKKKKKTKIGKQLGNVGGKNERKKFRGLWTIGKRRRWGCAGIEMSWYHISKTHEEKNWTLVYKNQRKWVEAGGGGFSAVFHLKRWGVHLGVCGEREKDTGRFFNRTWSVLSVGGKKGRGMGNEQGKREPWLVIRDFGTRVGKGGGGEGG